MSTDTPHVHLCSTGGTIQNPLDVDGYISGEELVQNVPEIGDEFTVTTSDVSLLESNRITPEIWFRLHAEIVAVCDAEPGLDGVVVTSGSNAVEETAYFLNLTLPVEVPVVVTGAQRNHGTVGNDGDRNLLDSFRVASHPDAEGRGVLVVTNDLIHQARDVTKLHSGRTDTWQSGDVGALGLVDKYGRIQFYRQTERAHAPDDRFDIEGASATTFPRVDVVYAVAGADGTLVEAAVDAGAEGIVVAGFPTGIPADPVDTGGQKKVLEAAVESGVPVVMSHRGSDGWPHVPILEESPFLWADNLRPPKARILLALALHQTDDPAQLQRYFFRY